MFRVERILHDGSKKAQSPAFDHSPQNFKDKKRELHFALNVTFSEVYKSYLHYPRAGKIQ